MNDLELARSLFYEGSALLDAGEYAKAEARLREAHRLMPRRASILTNLSAALLKQGKFDDAGSFAGLSVEVDAGNAEGWLNLGNVLAAQGRLEEALERYERALALQPDLAAAREARSALHETLAGQARSGEAGPSPWEHAASLHRAGRLEEAERACRSIVEADPADAQAWMLLGVIRLQRGDAAQGIGLIDRSLAIAPDQPLALNNRGNALLALQRDAEALASFDRAIELREDFAEAHSNRGIALLKLGRTGEAAASCRRAIELKPDLAEAHGTLGNVQRKLGKFEESLECYRRALAIEPDSADTHNYAGLALQALRRTGEALASYLEALSLKPDFAEAHSNLGQAYHDLGRTEEALASYRKALELKPDLAQAHNNLATVLQDYNRHDEAAASCRAALAIEPNLVEAHCNLANLFKEFGQLQDALAEYRRALEIDPSCSSAFSNLLLAMNYVPGIGPAEMLRSHLEYSRRFSPEKRAFRPP